MNQIKEHANENVVKILVGNKCDLINERKIDQSEGQKLANSFSEKIPFIEVSAKENIEIDSLF